MSKPFQVKCPCCSHEFTFKRISKHHRANLDERFWSKVYCDPNTGCFLWYGALDGSGRYGEFRMPSDDPFKDSENVRTHRYSFERVNGPIPKGMVVMHTCDTPRCVNPAHLKLGTQLENMRDCAAKGRSRQKMTFETASQIKAMRSAGDSCKKICTQLALPKSTVQAVLDGRTWRHVPVPKKEQDHA